MRFGSRPTSSAKRQNSTRLRKCATASGWWPRSCIERAIPAKLVAAARVTSSGVCRGRSAAGSDITARSTPSASAVRSPPAARSSSVTVWTLGRVLVKLVWTSIRSMSLTTSRGGFSSASR